MMDTTFTDKIANLIYERFSKLPKKGKPQNRKEWTLLSSVVMSISCDSSEETKFKVVALATGTKCLGQSFLSCKGDMVSDSHAEVLARRAFMKYISYHVSLVLSGEKSPVLQSSEKSVCEVKSGVQFHFFISHSPCGDASIFPKFDVLDEVVSTTFTQSHTLKRDIEDLQNMPKKFKSDNIISCDLSFSSNNQQSKNKNLINYKQPFEDKKNVDIFRTGAKCVQGEVQDPKGEGVDYHVTGVLRTKPGRGDPTLCMSCSDKMAVWNICGLQGALNSHFLSEPIYWTSIVIGKSTFSKCALDRAIVGRTSEVIGLPTGYKRAFPSIYHSAVQFEYSKENIEKLSEKVVPCPAAIIWCDVPEKNLDVCVNGKRQGIVKRNLDKPSSWVNICRRKLFEEFSSVVSLIPKEKLSDELRNVLQQNGSYSDFKKAAFAYQEAKKAVFDIFDGWTQKPEYLQKFYIDHCK